MTPTGPIYCETGHPWLFMAEPVNTITNIFILIAAVAAFVEIRRARIGLPLDLAILLFLLVVTGIGSFAWHGMRTRIALTFDALPGLMFLFVFAGFWLRELWGRWAGFAGAVLLLAASVTALYFGRRLMAGLDGLPGAMFLIPAYVVIAIFGMVLYVATRERFGAAIANRGGIAVVCGIVAATCRSIDMMVCSLVPFGTHFVWHILLSFAAYQGIVMLTRLKVLTRTDRAAG